MEAGDVTCLVCNKSFRTRSLASDGITKCINFSACIVRGSVKG